MSKATKHAYEIVFSQHENESLQVGQILVDKNHVRKEHEPNRDWCFFNLDTYEERVVTGKHIGEYEKVKNYLGGGE